VVRSRSGRKARAGPDAPRFSRFFHRLLPLVLVADRARAGRLPLGYHRPGHRRGAPAESAGGDPP